MAVIQFLLLFGLVSAAEQEVCKNIDKETLKSFQDNNKDFADVLHRHIKPTTNGNKVYSPWSISVALGMVMGGAKGKTLQQMKELLAKDLKTEEIGPAYWTFIDDVATKPKDAKYSIYTANAMYVQTGFNLVKQFRFQHIQQCLMGEALEVDFKEPEKVRKEVNNDVLKQTHDKIKDLLPENSIGSLTRMILVNTLYLKAAWLKPFDKWRTKKGNFISVGEQKQEVEFMNGRGYYKYLEDERIQILMMDYVGGTMSLFILLPKIKLTHHTDLKQAIKSIIETKEKYVDVKIPKFKIKFQLKAKDVLMKMGIKDMFEAKKADLTGICKPSLYIDNIYHQAVFDVNENGTEASAAAAVVAKMPMREPEPEVKFVADHPFMFILYHHVADSFIFIGSVLDMK